MKKKVLYVYRTRRKQILDDWHKGKGPDNMLFGLNHLRQMGYQVDFFDVSYSFFNPLHWLFYPLEHAVIHQIGMGFKIDQAVTLLPLIRRYDAIVLTSDSAGMPFLWLKYMKIIDKPMILLGGGTSGVLRANYNSWVVPFYRKILSAVDIMTCYAKVEIDFFTKKMEMAKDKVRYIPYGTDWWFYSKPSKRKRTIVAAAGVDESRDYKTFFAAVKGLDAKVEVACRPDNVAGLDIPANVKVEYVDSYLKMRNLFRRARVMVVPLKEINRSAGQMVVLESASAGCPLVVSKVKGITGAYKFEDGKHLLFTPTGDPGTLQQQIKSLLEEPLVGEAMGKRISRFVRKNYTSKHLAADVAKFIDELS